MQLEKYLFFVIQYSGILSILNKETNDIYSCNVPSIQMDYKTWCAMCFDGLENPFSVEEMIDFHQWAISYAYVGLVDSPMNWDVVRELAIKRFL